MLPRSSSSRGQAVRAHRPRFASVEQAHRPGLLADLLQQHAGRLAGISRGKEPRRQPAAPTDPACRAGAIAKLRLYDPQHDSDQRELRFRSKDGRRREFVVRRKMQWDILAHVGAKGISADAKDGPFVRRCGGRSNRPAMV
jgi:hypothetical protein